MATNLQPAPKKRYGRHILAVIFVTLVVLTAWMVYTSMIHQAK